MAMVSFTIPPITLLCSPVINIYGLRLAYDNCRKQVVSRIRKPNVLIGGRWYGNAHLFLICKYTKY